MFSSRNLLQITDGPKAHHFLSVLHSLLSLEIDEDESDVKWKASVKLVQQASLVKRIEDVEKIGFVKGKNLQSRKQNKEVSTQTKQDCLKNGQVIEPVQLQTTDAALTLPSPASSIHSSVKSKLYKVFKISVKANFPYYTFR